jgi:hypothetical protein
MNINLSGVAGKRFTPYDQFAQFEKSIGESMEQLVHTSGFTGLSLGNSFLIQKWKRSENLKDRQVFPNRAGALKAEAKGLQGKTLRQDVYNKINSPGAKL